VLVIHGFTGSPFEMRLLGEDLAARGFAVEGVKLAGHAGTTRELAATMAFLASAEGGYITGPAISVSGGLTMN